MSLLRFLVSTVIFIVVTGVAIGGFAARVTLAESSLLRPFTSALRSLGGSPP